MGYSTNLYLGDHHLVLIAMIIHLGKLDFFTNLDCWAIKGDDFPYQPSFMVRSIREVVIKFTQIHIIIIQYHLVGGFNPSEKY